MVLSRAGYERVGVGNQRVGRVGAEPSPWSTPFIWGAWAASDDGDQVKAIVVSRGFLWSWTWPISDRNPTRLAPLRRSAARMDQAV